jgi:hypothetical protein
MQDNPSKNMPDPVSEIRDPEKFISDLDPGGKNGLDPGFRIYNTYTLLS